MLGLSRIGVRQRPTRLPAGAGAHGQMRARTRTFQVIHFKSN